MEGQKDPKADALALTLPEIELARRAVAEHVEREGASGTSTDLLQLLANPLQLRTLASMRPEAGEPA